MHMDQADPNDFQAGLFNGARIRTVRHNQSDYWLNVTFLALQGQASCIIATATMTNGDTQATTWGTCGDPPPAPPPPPPRRTRPPSPTPRACRPTGTCRSTSS